MRHLQLPPTSSALPRSVPVLGLGTWRLGESATTRPEEIASLRTAFELGYKLIDTAEMYGEGGAEQVVGIALRDAMRAGAIRREDITIVSKVYPRHASRAGVQAACDRSRQRLGVDTIDLYLLHWRGEFALRETVDGFQALAAAGQIGRWGVSNFDVDDMAELTALDDACALNQVWYSLHERDPEFALLPWLREHQMPLMAYSPIDQGRAAQDPTLQKIAHNRGLTAVQIALAALLAEPGVLAIPKSIGCTHLRENLAAAEVVLTPDECAAVERRFPRPQRKAPLAMN